ncbi:MAG: HAD-IA family hydrolase [Candidatus Hydrogenedentes bacterium]|nr:HAD-IA family hydrolase [Candidatus Hydrogenedentota bacterium]
MSFRYEAVLFDAGNTLLRVEPSVGEIYSDTARRHGVNARAEDIERHFRVVFAERDGDLVNYTSEAAEREWWRNVVHTVFDRAGCRADFGSRFEEFFGELHNLFLDSSVWRVFEDVRPVLEQLNAMGIRRAIASNWDSRLPQILDSLGLSESFEFVITSSAVGRSKPHPLLFERALERLGLTPERVVYVGDSYDHDVVGARGAGLAALHLDRHSNGTPQAGTLRSLAELPDWLVTRAGR